MLGTFVFHASDCNAQKACREAAEIINGFTREARIGREQIVSTNTNYQSTLSEGSIVSECVITLIIDGGPNTLKDWQTLYQSLLQEQQQKSQEPEPHPFDPVDGSGENDFFP